MEMENKMKNEEKSNGELLHAPLGKDIQDEKEKIDDQMDRDDSIIGFAFTKDDHENEMDEKKKLHDYKMIYEEAITKREKDHVIPKRITDFTADKRRFGLEKYGGYSFQISFENSVTCKINEHIKSEIVDLLNYINHRDLIRSFKGIEIKDSGRDINLLINLFEEADELSSKEE